MQIRTMVRVIALLTVTCLALRGLAWGFHAHRLINRYAVYTLPPDLFALYKPAIDHLAAHAVDPDRRRYAVRGEACRHYIDLERYGRPSAIDLPRRWPDAVERHGLDTLVAYGILPWAIRWELDDLVDAFRAGDRAAILRHSADLGHYVADAHVPLHTSINYDGQRTGQHGIHAFWESRVPELFSDDYDYWLGRAVAWNPVDSAVWAIVLDSHRRVDSVLSIERDLRARWDPDRVHVTDVRGSSTTRAFAPDYAAAYEQALNGMVRRRLRRAVRAVGSAWTTAWILAGRPAPDGSLDTVAAPPDTLRILTDVDPVVRPHRGTGGP